VYSNSPGRGVEVGVARPEVTAGTKVGVVSVTLIVVCPGVRGIDVGGGAGVITCVPAVVGVAVSEVPGVWVTAPETTVGVALSGLARVQAMSPKLAIRAPTQKRMAIVLIMRPSSAFHTTQEELLSPFSEATSPVSTKMIP